MRSGDGRVSPIRPCPPRGEEQAAQAGRLLRQVGISAALSSDLRRARSTAETISAALGLDGPVGIESRLREYDLGAWSGLTRVEIESRWPGAIDQWRQGRLVATPGGETRAAFVARITAAITEILAAATAETIVVVTHGGVISALGLWLGEPPRRFTHLSGFWIESNGDGLGAGALVSLLEVDRTVPDDTEGTALAAPDVPHTNVLDTAGR